MQGLAIYQFGIVTTLEATKYIDQANQLLQHGRYETGNFLFYSTEILLIAACQKLQIGYWPVVAVHLLLNAIATVCFYRLVKQFTGRSTVAFWFTLAFIGMFYYQLYTTYLFTESPYFSLLLIFFYGLMQVRKLTTLTVLGMVTGLAVLYFTRPVGLFVIPATFLFIVFRFYPTKSKLIISTAGVTGVGFFYLLLNKSLNSGGELNFLLPYLDERIICGVPTITTPHQISVPVEQDSVEGLFYIITHHWRLFATLSLKRLLAFFGVVRSWYSLPHNIFIAVYFYSMYVLIFIGSRRWNRERLPQLLFIGCLLFLTALTTAVSCDEWHNRFILALLPFLLLLSSLAFVSKPLKTVADA